MLREDCLAGARRAATMNPPQSSAKKGHVTSEKQSERSEGLSLSEGSGKVKLGHERKATERRALTN